MSDLITDAMAEKARQAIEDAAIERRDSMIFVMCGNGITVRNRDGSDSAIHRMRSDEAFRIGFAAIADDVARSIATAAWDEGYTAGFGPHALPGPNPWRES